MEKIEAWLEDIYCEGKLEPASSDASFRKYYRLNDGIQSSIIMDASLQKESIEPFVDIAFRLRDAKVTVPKILVQNREEGFLMLEDMGSRHLLETIDERNFVHFYDKAIDTIVKMQGAVTEALPAYDEGFLRAEMDLMQEWYLEKYLGKSLSEEEQQTLDEILNNITQEVLAQPQGYFVHRDFHSRNIMLNPHDEIVVIDFQDARVGAVTYDLVSLLRDCYVSFDPQKIEALALSFRDKRGLDVDNATFIRWFDFMGLQRHIKVLGIFSRLYLRDGKEGYLKDIPLTLKYVLDVAGKYEETKGLVDILT
ncbi:aminoglycoside phosphotransferase family protein [Sulfurovum mangrovi]|uniref:aminoglycoside phosphotransferase family protein n=1 Tax=Sulfurovum mangrovi TaxID=2893889 RepID=UPI001E37CE87|nr:phosphotransferase [Sulfurovum mangrovi]UFH58072.1 phosphotransferase [Sulfurovum mangrovi]